MMPNIGIYAKVKCPYFLRMSLNRKSVICEGLVPGSEIINCFTKSEELTGWVSGVCESHGYAEHCLLAKAVSGKYDDSPD